MSQSCQIIKKNPSTFVEMPTGEFCGHAERWGHGWGFYGKFASHTGFQSVLVDDDVEPESIIEIGRSLFNKQRAFSFLVGEEYKEFGGKTLNGTSCGKIEIRIPVWTSEVIRKALIFVGFQESCSLNSRWISIDPITISRAKEILTPLLLSGTRFSDENELAGQLIDSYACAVKFNSDNQLTLF